MKPFTLINKALTFTLAAAALTFASCKKDNNSQPDQAAAHQLVKYEESASNYTTFSYDASGRISKMTGFEDNQSEEFNITYGANNKPSQASSSQHAVKFAYTNNLLDKAEIYYGAAPGTLFGYTQLSYSNSKVSQMITYASIPGMEGILPMEKVTYEYYANGDVKTKKAYDYNVQTMGFDLSSIVAYEYDNQKNPLAALGELFQVSFDMPSQHNITKETHTDADGNLTNTITYTYTYDSAGYPTQAEKKSTAPGQPNTDVSHLKFSYK